MDKNIIALWVVVWANICIGSEYKVINLGSVDCFQESPSDTLQVFFKKKDENYIPAARVTGSKNVLLNNIHDCRWITTKKNFIGNTGFTCTKEGGFVVFGENNPSHKYPFLCENKEGVKEILYIKVLHHTGVTEKLLDMPECSVELGSDNIQLNLPKLNEPSSGVDNHTIIDPSYVNIIRKYIEDGKIFVINVESEIGKLKSYKVLRYKNNAFVHWKDWSPREWFWKCIGKDLELGGFEDADKVQPEKEIEIDLWKQDGTRYYRNQRIAWFIKVLSIGSCSLAVCYLLLQDKIADVLWK